MKTPSPLSHLSGASGFRPAFLRLTLLLGALALPCIASAGNLEGRYATITLDGTLSGWLPTDVLYSASEIGAGAPLASTFTNVMVANDSNYLYVALQLPAPASISNNWTYNLFLDTDMKGATGFNGGWMGGGYDHLVEYGASGTTYSVYSFSGAAQSDWTWNWLDVIQYAYSDYVIEWAVPLSALGTNTTQMKMEFDVTGGDVTTETWAYQWESGVGTYTLATPPSTSAPTLVAVEGAPNRVQVTFSKPVDPATAGAATNYALSGGLTVLSATPDTINQRKVALTTSQQSRGTNYTLTVNHVKDQSGSPIAPNSQMTFVSSILIDGSFDDWDGIPMLSNNDPGNPAATDFKEVYGYSDTNYVYLRVTLWEPSNLFNSQNNFFFDTDNDVATGYTAWGGAELLIQGGTGYQEKNGGFNEGLINGLNLVSANSGATNYEFRISRAATYASDGTPVFRANVINFAFDGETNWVTANRMPPTYGTIPFTLAEIPIPLGPLTITSSGGQVSLKWPGGGTLQACDSVISGTWTNVEGAYSGFSMPASEKKLYFRLTQ